MKSKCDKMLKVVSFEEIMGYAPFDYVFNF